MINWSDEGLWNQSANCHIFFDLCKTNNSELPFIFIKTSTVFPLFYWQGKWKQIGKINTTSSSDSGDFSLKKIIQSGLSISLQPVFLTCALIQLIHLVVWEFQHAEWSLYTQVKDTGPCMLQLMQPHTNWAKRTIHLHAHCCQKEIK